MTWRVDEHLKPEALANGRRKWWRDPMGGPHNSPHLHHLKRPRDCVDDHLEGRQTQRYVALLLGAKAKTGRRISSCLQTGGTG